MARANPPLPRMSLGTRAGSPSSILYRTSGAAGVLTVVAGTLVLAGWALDVRFLKGFAPSLATTKPNAAIGFMLAGGALLLLRDQRHSAARGRAVGRVLAGGAVLIGALTLLEYAVGGLGLDELLFRDPEGRYPGRMSPAAALYLVEIGAALIGLDAATKRGRQVTEALLWTVMIVVLLGLVGYAYSVDFLLGQSGGTTGLSPMGAIVLPVLTAGVLAARPNLRPVSSLLGEEPAAVVVRRLLPIALAVPFLLGILYLRGHEIGLFRFETGAAIYAASMMLALVGLVAVTGRRLNRLTLQRRRAEARQRSSEAAFRAMAEGAPDGIVTADEEGRILFFERRGGAAACRSQAPRSTSSPWAS